MHQRYRRRTLHPAGKRLHLAFLAFELGVSVFLNKSKSRKSDSKTSVVPTTWGRNRVNDIKWRLLLSCVSRKEIFFRRIPFIVVILILIYMFLSYKHRNVWQKLTTSEIFVSIKCRWRSMHLRHSVEFSSSHWSIELNESCYASICTTLAHALAQQIFERDTKMGIVFV